MLLVNFYRFGAGCTADPIAAYAIASYVCLDQDEAPARALLDTLEMNVPTAKRGQIQKLLGSVKNAQDLLNNLPS